METIDAGVDSGGWPVADGRWATASRFLHEKRWWLSVSAGFLALVLIAAVGTAYFAHSRTQAAARSEARAQARADAVQAAARTTENLAMLAAARQAHQQIMEASAPPAALAGLESAARPAPADEPLPAPAAASAAAAPVMVGQSAAVPPRSRAQPQPAVTGGCALSGGSPRDYGAALGRCLEEFRQREESRPGAQVRS